MANEGSTKPTYSELEELRRIKAVRGQHDCDCEVCSTVSRVCPASASSYALEIIGLRAENLRVRGLLQRQLDFAKVLRRIHHGHQVTIGGKLYVTAHTLIDYAKGYEKGAESADIGKLDTADAKLRELVKALKVACETVIADGDTSLSPQYWLNRIEGLADKSGVEMGKVNRVEEKADEILKDLMQELGYVLDMGGELSLPIQIQMKKASAYLDSLVPRLGSAETGGENAAPPYPDSQEIDRFCKDIEERVGKCCGDNLNLTSSELWLEIKEWLPTFHRRSQNQTVSGGVEGAHEGTTADEKGEKVTLAPQLCNWMMSRFNPGTGAVYCNEPEGHEGQHRHTFPAQTYPAREPEKLNNAQKADELIDDLRLLLAGDFLTVKDRASARIVITKWLAESSLSSPPHLDDE